MTGIISFCTQVFHVRLSRSPGYLDLVLSFVLDLGCTVPDVLVKAVKELLFNRLVGVQKMASWLCPNCVQNQHQCFICGQLGKSDGDDKEVSKDIRN